MKIATLPTKLQRHIERVLKTAQKHPGPDLAISTYRPIYKFFDALPPLSGRIARTHLSILVAKRVVHIWDSLPPDYGYSTLPRLLISIAGQFLAQMRKSMTVQQLDELAKTRKVKLIVGTQDDPIETYHLTIMELVGLTEEMDSITCEPPYSLYHQPWCAFLAAMTSLHEALGWNWRNMDIPQLAAIASGGGKWSALEKQDILDPEGVWDYSSPETRMKRIKFWQWWCRKAIPTVWNALDLSQK